jgi:hypothetical protein
MDLSTEIWKLSPFILDSASIFIGVLSSWRHLYVIQTYLDKLIEWVVATMYITPNEQIFSNIMARTSYIRWHDNDVWFVLDKHVTSDILKMILRPYHDLLVVLPWYNNCRGHPEVNHGLITRLACWLIIGLIQNSNFN